MQSAEIYESRRDGRARDNHSREVDFGDEVGALNQAVAAICVAFEKSPGQESRVGEDRIGMPPVCASDSGEFAKKKEREK